MPNAFRHIWSQYNKLFFSVFKMACHQMTNVKKKHKFHKCKCSSNHRRSSIRELPRILRNLSNINLYFYIQGSCAFYLRFPILDRQHALFVLFNKNQLVVIHTF